MGEPLLAHALHPSTRTLPGRYPGGRVEGVGGPAQRIGRTANPSTTGTLNVQSA
jgi:hypothetical protein